MVAGDDEYQCRMNTNQQWHRDEVLTGCECVSSHSVAAIATLQQSAMVRDCWRQDEDNGDLLYDRTTAAMRRFK